MSLIHYKGWSFSAMLIALLAFTVQGLFASPVAYEMDRLEAAFPAGRDGFGMAVDSNGPYLLVGAPGESDFQERELFGSVSLFSITEKGFLRLKEIPGPTDSMDRRFGASVAMGENYFVVGSANDFNKDNNPRAVVHIYEKDFPIQDGWGLAATIRIPNNDLYSADQLIKVNCSGDTIRAGMSGMEKVIIIDRIGGSWHQSGEVLDPNPENFGNFGCSLDVEGDKMVVGARLETVLGEIEGAVYYFEKINGHWVEKQRISPILNDWWQPKQFWFGAMVEISGEWLAATDAGGTICLFRWNQTSSQWDAYQNVVISPGGADSISLSGNELLIGGMDYDSGDHFNTGEAIIFRHPGGNLPEDQWREAGRLRGRIPAMYSRLGGAVKIAKDRYFVGSGLVDGGFTGPLPSGGCLMFNKPAFVSYPMWREAHFTQEQTVPAISAPEAVVNNGGISNLLAYAFGLDPWAPDLNGLPRMVKEVDGSLGFKFQLTPGSFEAGYLIYKSDDFSSWQPLKMEGWQINYSGEVQEISVPIVPSDGRQFFKVEVMGLGEHQNR